MMCINLLKLKCLHIDYKMVKKTNMKLKHLNAKGHNLVKTFGLKTPFKYLIVFISNMMFIKKKSFFRIHLCDVFNEKMFLIAIDYKFKSSNMR
jgi:phage anti-repressor protein